MPELQRRARHDPAICGAPGLFRSLARGTREKPLEISYVFGSETLRFRSPVRLGCDDLRVLQGIMTLATIADVAIDADTKTASLGALRSALRLDGDLTESSVLLVQTNLAALARVAGYAERGGALGRHLRASLGRLANCRIESTAHASTSGWHLLSWEELPMGRDRLRIALNPRSSHCARGDHRYTLIDMDEARGLHDDVARLCHQRLSTWIDASPKPRHSVAPFDQKRVRLSTLWKYAWGESTDLEQLTAAAARQRRVTLRKAIEALRSMGWRIDEVDVGAGIYSIVRPPNNRGALQRGGVARRWSDAELDVAAF